MRRGVRGFTLLEAMTAVAIAGIAATLAVTGFQALGRRQREADAARAVYGALVKARQDARVSGQPTRVVVVRDADGHRQARWERPSCEEADGGLEPPCPESACTDAPCGGDCSCDAMGAPIALPDALEVSLAVGEGVCFLPGTGRPRALDCEADGTAVTEVRLWAQGQADEHVVQLERLTGQPALTHRPHAAPGTPDGGAD